MMKVNVTCSLPNLHWQIKMSDPFNSHKGQIKLLERLRPKGYSSLDIFV